MSDQIDLLLRVSRPKIDGEDEVRCIDITVRHGEFQLSPGMYCGANP